MPLIEWSDVFSVNVKKFDEEHKKFIAIINKFDEDFRESRIDENMLKTIDELINFAQTHFSSEEKYLEQLKYPGLLAQKQEHSIFLTTMNEVKKSFEHGKMVSAIGLMNYMKSWLVDHIMGLDKKYSEYVRILERK